MKYERYQTPEVPMLLDVDIEPGSLDGAEGVAERHGRAVARVALQDDRRWNIVKVPIPGAPDGEKPTHVSGALAIRFIEKADDELSRHLGEVSERRDRIDSLPFDIQLDDGRRLEDCSVAGPLGGSNGAFWFLLDV